LPDSYEGILHTHLTSLGDPKQILSFQTLLPTSNRLEHPCVDKIRQLLEGPARLQRWIGVCYKADTEVQSHYGKLSLRGCYDQVIFVDTTSALVPIRPRPQPSTEASSALISRASSQRLMKELKRLRTHPPPGIEASPIESNLLEWHFVLHPSEGVYANGEYHGRLDFPPEYPMAPPAIRVFTPSGRFEPGVRLCLSMSDYHPESWNPSWSVETILVGLQSFMYEESNAIGSISASLDERKILASLSKCFNRQNPIFCSLFNDNGDTAISCGEEVVSASVCRFCFSSEGELISPCMCRGSNEWVHLTCLKEWQKAVVLTQPTHPKYQTNIDEVCNVCCEPFQGPGIAKSNRREQILAYVGGAKIAALVAPGNLLISTREASRENLELAAAHPEIASRLSTWTRAVFLMLHVDKSGGLIAVSTSQPISEPPKDIRMSAKIWAKSQAQAEALAPGLLSFKHFDGGPCDRNNPLCIAHLPKFVDVPGIGRASPSWVYGSLDAVAAAIKISGHRTMVNVAWGYGGWGGTQVLAEIGRGGWGLLTSADFTSQRPDPSLEPSFELDFEWSRVVSLEGLRLAPKSEYTQRGKK
jgi:ubiquitin-conjugating enzyme E2 J2